MERRKSGNCHGSKGTSALSLNQYKGTSTAHRERLQSNDCRYNNMVVTVDPSTSFMSSIGSLSYTDDGDSFMFEEWDKNPETAVSDDVKVSTFVCNERPEISRMASFVTPQSFDQMLSELAGDPRDDSVPSRSRRRFGGVGRGKSAPQQPNIQDTQPLNSPTRNPSMSPLPLIRRTRSSPVRSQHGVRGEKTVPRLSALGQQRRQASTTTPTPPARSRPEKDTICQTPNSKTCSTQPPTPCSSLSELMACHLSHGSSLGFVSDEESVDEQVALQNQENELIQYALNLSLAEQSGFDTVLSKPTTSTMDSILGESSLVGSASESTLIELLLELES